MRPGVDDFVVALAVRDVAGLIRALEPLDALGRFAKQRFFLRRDVEVFDPDGDTTARRVEEAEFLQSIEELDRRGKSGVAVALEHELAERLLLHVAVLERNALRDDRVEQRAPDRRQRPRLPAVVIDEVANRRLPLHVAVRQRHLDLRDRDEFTQPIGRLLVALVLREFRGRLRRHVASEHNVLARLGDGATVRRLENVVRREHEQPALELCLERQWHVHGHLVPVEVGVERRANERVNSNGLAFYQNRLKCLNTESVERRGAVQQHRVIADDLLEDLVHLGALTLHDLLGALHRLGDALLDELVK